MNRSNHPRNEMLLGDRSSFAREWLEDALLQQEKRRVFSAFFSGYVALVAASSQMAGDHGEFRKYENQLDEHLERKAIEFAMSNRAVEINEFIDSVEGVRATGSLRSREVPEGEEFKMIGSVNDPQLLMAASSLFSLWSPLANTFKSKTEIVNQANYLGLVFRKVRNRLFHGGKMNDPNGTDADLLERINPILFGVVKVLLVH